MALKGVENVSGLCFKSSGTILMCPSNTTRLIQLCKVDGKETAARREKEHQWTEKGQRMDQEGMGHSMRKNGERRKKKTVN